MNTLHICIVGHTNTGKTSLIRTLLRDDTFGEVRNAAATTRHIEAKSISLPHTSLSLYDTPGLEDASGLLEWLNQHTPHHQDGIERLHLFFSSPEASTLFSQEAKVLRQLIQSDAALYVIDTREPILEQYKDELTILSWCTKPIMPVFNFTTGKIAAHWQQFLARKNIHTHSAFDTIAFDFKGEINLWEKLNTMLPSPKTLIPFIEYRRQEWQQLQDTAYQLIAHFLLDIAAYQHTLNKHEKLPEIQDHMQEQVRQAEQKFQTQLLHHYRFYQSETHPSIPQSNLLTYDPFDTELLKKYGIKIGTSAAIGAAVGAGFDLLTAGLSLGAGTTLGGLIGGLLPHHKLIYNTLSGKEHLFIDDTSLLVLAVRALTLLSLLQTRGHASQSLIDVSSHHKIWPQLPTPLKQARNHEKWSSLNTHNPYTSQQLRQNITQELTKLLQQQHQTTF